MKVFSIIMNHSNHDLCSKTFCFNCENKTVTEAIDANDFKCSAGGKCCYKRNEVCGVCTLDLISAGYQLFPKFIAINQNDPIQFHEPEHEPITPGNDQVMLEPEFAEPVFFSEPIPYEPAENLKLDKEEYDETYMNSCKPTTPGKKKKD